MIYSNETSYVYWRWTGQKDRVANADRKRFLADCGKGGYAFGNKWITSGDARWNSQVWEEVDGRFARARKRETQRQGGPGVLCDATELDQKKRQQSTRERERHNDNASDGRATACGGT